ncbi:MAG: lamin tail domain-containing protein, partial [bacterium]
MRTLLVLMMAVISIHLCAQNNARVQSNQILSTNFNQSLYLESRDGEVLFVEDPAGGYGPATKPDPQWIEVLDSVLGTGNYGWYGATASATEDGPGLDTMLNYDLVIWNCYDHWDAIVLTDNDTTNIASYLSQGGKVWLIGQDLLYSGVPLSWLTTNFLLQNAFEDYIPSGIGTVNLAGISELSGISFSTTFDYNLNPFFPDGLVPATGAHHLIEDSDSSYTLGIIDNNHTASFWTIDGRITSPYSQWQQTVTVMLGMFGVLPTPEVCINEFQIKGTEWVELYNYGTTAVDITDWILYSSEDGDTYTIPTASIAAGDRILLSGIGYIMDNSGDSLFLETDGGTVVDMVAYGDMGPAPLAITDWSCSRITDGLMTGDMARDFNIDGSPTPDTPNDAHPAPLNGMLVVNELDPYPASGPDSVELFNPSMTQVVNTAGWLLSDGDEVDTFASLIIYPLEYVVIDETQFGFDFASTDVAYLFTADTTRVDQLGYAGEYSDSSFQRIPNGCAPHDGYDWISSGGGVTLFDITETFGFPNGYDTLQLTYPNGGESFFALETIDVTWTGNVDYVDIWYTYNNWYTMELVAESVATPYEWVIPGTPSTQCQLAILNHNDPGVYDYTDDMFTIACQGLVSCDTLTYWSGLVETGISYGDPPEWMAMAILLTPTEIGAYAGDYVNRIIFQLRDGNNPAQDARVMILGDTLGDTLFDQPFTVTGDSGWYQIYLGPDSVYIDGTDMWILVGFTYETGNYPFPCNAQSLIAQKSDWA